MTYTLLGTPTLCFDLVRTARGEHTASLLLTALALGRDDLTRLATAHPGARRRALLDQALQQSTTRRQAGRDSLQRAGALPAGDAARVILRELETSRLGTAEALDRLVRREILDWTWRSARDAIGGTSSPTQSYVALLASDVIADAIVASYVYEDVEPALAQDLSRPFEGARFELRDSHPGSLPPQTSSLINRLAGTTEAERARLLQSVETLRKDTAAWAPAMHEATWAAQLSGRVRTAAAAQLLAVRAFRSTSITSREAAAGAWNAVSGAIGASVVSDLLSDEHHSLLSRAWTQAFGTD